ncbi:MAG: DUF4335 domain-containing protein [Elainella sp. Prado103]|jgi:hypothetical protein|nr:DUF4335 domain-containing protein [Elainella sp. Prado103]
MTIQRQYSLPNCKLVVQGLNNSAEVSPRPLLSVVTNVECYLTGQKVPLTGGREFLENLATAVSDYAQGYLSGIQHLVRRARQHQDGLVQIEQVGQNLHRLTAKSEAAAPPTEMTLTTVQFFDLVEAIDQLFADAQTLPELALKLTPLSRRNVISQEPITKRATPIAIGASSLAAAAALLFMLPVPEVKQPTPTEGETTEQTTSSAAEQSANSTPSPASSDPPSSSPADSSTNSPTASSPTNSPISAPTDSTSTNSTADPASDNSANSGTTTAANAGSGVDLTNSPNITDSGELDRLTVQLYDRLDLAWKQTPSFDGELIYRVGMSPNGEIVGYKYSNDAALTYLNETPLANVQFSPATEGNPEGAAISGSDTTPIAQFRVVFKSNGVLEVSPWDGQPTPPVSPTP